MSSQETRTAAIESGHRRSEAGFTLSEMLVVVVIVGLAAMVAVPNVGAFFKAYKVRSANEQLVQHLRAARQIAVTQRLPVTFTINPSPTNTYSFSYTIPGKPTTTNGFKIAGHIAVTTTPTGPLTWTLNQNGTVANPSTPDDQNPTNNFVRISAPIGMNRTDQYTVTLLVAGKVSSSFTR